MGSIPGLERSPGGGHSNPLQYSSGESYSPWGHKELDTTERISTHTSKIYKQHLKLNKKKANDLIKKWAKHQKRHFTKLDIQMASKHMARCSKSYVTAVAAAKLLQSCPTLCNPMDGSPPGSPVPGILQARTRLSFTISQSLLNSCSLSG